MYWLGGILHTAELDSAVWCTPRSMTQRCDAHRGVRLGGGMHPAEFFEKLWSLDTAVGCTPQTPRYKSHRGVWLWGVMHTAESDSTVGCTPWSFLKIRISRRNRNRTRKYFSLFIRGPDGFWIIQNRISWHTHFISTVLGCGGDDNLI